MERRELLPTNKDAHPKVNQVSFQIRPHFFTELKDTSSGNSSVHPMADAHSYTALTVVYYLGPTIRSPLYFPLLDSALENVRYRRLERLLSARF